MRGIGAGGGGYQLARGGGFEVFFHDLEIVFRAGDRALGRVDDPAHHEHRLLGHGHHLQQHDHVTEGEVALERAPKDHRINAQED